MERERERKREREREREREVPVASGSPLVRVPVLSRTAWVSLPTSQFSKFVGFRVSGLEFSL